MKTSNKTPNGGQVVEKPVVNNDKRGKMLKKAFKVAEKAKGKFKSFANKL